MTLTRLSAPTANNRGLTVNAQEEVMAHRPGGIRGTKAREKAGLSTESAPDAGKRCSDPDCTNTPHDIGDPCCVDYKPDALIERIVATYGYRDDKAYHASGTSLNESIRIALRNLMAELRKEGRNG